MITFPDDIPSSYRRRAAPCGGSLKAARVIKWMEPQVQRPAQEGLCPECRTWGPVNSMDCMLHHEYMNAMNAGLPLSGVVEDNHAPVSTNCPGSVTLAPKNQWWQECPHCHSVQPCQLKGGGHFFFYTHKATQHYREAPRMTDEQEYYMTTNDTTHFVFVGYAYDPTGEDKTVIRSDPFLAKDRARARDIFINSNDEVTTERLEAGWEVRVTQLT